MKTAFLIVKQLSLYKQGKSIYNKHELQNTLTTSDKSIFLKSAVWLSREPP